MKEGINLALKEINANKGINGHQLKVFFEDDQGPNPTAAANAVTKLITQDNVVALLGPHFSPGMLPSEPLLAKYQVPALTGASGPVVTQQGNKWVFRIRLNDASGAKMLVNYILDTLHWQKVGLTYVNTAFGQSGIKAVEAALKARGITPAMIQTHLDSTKDFTPQLLAFQQAGVDGVIAWTDDQPGGLIVKQMSTLGVRYKLAGSTTFSQPPFLTLAGANTANGIVAVSDFIQDNPAQRIQDWEKKYDAAYGAKPEIYASVYYDAMNMLAEALRHTDTYTGPAIQQALTKISSFQGAMTTYTFSSNGDMVHSGLITQVVDGRPKVIKEVSEQ